MRLIRRLPIFLLAATVSLGAAACGGGGDDDVDITQPDVDPAGTNNFYVMDSIAMPTTANQARMLGLNLDGDPRGEPDNALGQILSTLAGQAGGDFTLQESIDTQVNDGSIILLANIKAKALTTATGVGAWLYLGETPSNMPCVDMNDTRCRGHLDTLTTFGISSTSPTDALVSGDIIGGKFKGGPGTVSIELSLVGNDKILFELVGARMEISAVAADKLTGGLLGGAITEDTLDNDVLPALHSFLSDSIAEDCMGTAPPCCPEGSTGQLLIDLFDENDPNDCMVTLEELKTNSLISSLLAPDVDLFDGPASAGKFNPRKDGVKDSLSLGIGFTGVPATFTLPPM